MPIIILKAWGSAKPRPDHFTTAVRLPSVTLGGGGAFFMTDLPTWDELSAATERVMAAAGLSKDEAQTRICCAIADGTLKFRAKVGWHTTRPVYGNRVLEERDFQISPDIKPDDFDWDQ